MCSTPKTYSNLKTKLFCDMQLQLVWKKVWPSHNNIHTLTWNSPSRRIFWVFRSWCSSGGVMLWRKFTPRAISYRTRILSGQANTGYMVFCYGWNRVTKYVHWITTFHKDTPLTDSKPHHRHAELISHIPREAVHRGSHCSCILWLCRRTLAHCIPQKSGLCS